MLSSYCSVMSSDYDAVRPRRVFIDREGEIRGVSNLFRIDLASLLSSIPHS